jgi:DNA-binding IclR family transcriptional regulator
MNSVLNTLRVLEEVAMRQPIGVSELARATEIPKSSVQRCLVTLQEAGWLRVVDPEHARWGLTMKALSIGLRGTGEVDIKELADPLIKRLSAQTNETVHLVVRDGDECVIVAREDSTQTIRTFVEIGTHAPLHATSSGIAIMARLDEQEVDKLLKRRLKKYTESTVVSTEELRAEIERTRARGYAVNRSSWWRPHVSAIGAAITNGAGRPVAAVALSIPEMRWEPEAEADLGAKIRATADGISRLLATH